MSELKKSTISADELSSHMIDSMDKAFYDEFDPFYFWTMAAHLSTAEAPSVRMTDLAIGAEIADSEVLQEIKKSQSEYLTYAKYLVRVLRYFSSETLILFLLSGSKFGPFARAASVFRGSKFAVLIRTISSGQVPKGFELYDSGQAIPFESWISIQLTGNTNSLAELEGSDVIKLVIEEAKLLSERGAFNAYKHGKQVSFGKGASILVKLNHWGFRDLNEPLFGVNWIDWFESGAQDLSISLGTEEIETEQDQKRIFSTALLLSLACRVRRAERAGVSNCTIDLPYSLNLGKPVRRQKVKFDFRSIEKDKPNDTEV